MTLGEKLRKARQDAGLSQRQLCGEEITRNMLSQIENGSARPSMTTLQYLSRRLGLPVSFFLEEDAAVSSNRGCMDSAWAAFQKGDYSSALAVLENYRSPDPIYDREKAMLHPMVLLALAQQSIDAGRMPYARKLLDRVQDLEELAPWLPEFRARRLLLLDRMGEAVPAEELPELDAWLLLHAKAAMAAGDPGRAVQLLEACRVRDAAWSLLRGSAALAMEDRGAAAVFLREAEMAYPQQAVPLLERVYRELGDYRAAYEYACKARQG